MTLLVGLNNRCEGLAHCSRARLLHIPSIKILCRTLREVGKGAALEPNQLLRDQEEIAGNMPEEFANRPSGIGTRTAPIRWGESSNKRMEHLPSGFEFGGEGLVHSTIGVLRK